MAAARDSAPWISVVTVTAETLRTAGHEAIVTFDGRPDPEVVETERATRQLARVETLADWADRAGPADAAR